MCNFRFRRAPGKRWLLSILTALGIGVHAADIAPDGESPSHGADASAHAIRVLTWNVLAPSPLERLLGFVIETEGVTRARALMRQAKALDPDIVALQEVTAGFTEILAEDTDWEGYHVSVEGSEVPAGDLLVLSRYPFGNFSAGRTQWLLEPRGTQVLVHYRAELAPDFTLPPVIGTTLVRQALARELRTVLEGLERLAQSSTPPSPT